MQDRIETHLTSEIAGRYSSFFEASIYIQELQEDVQQLVGEIVTKRKDMESVVAEAQEGTETAITLRRRKQNLLKTLDLAMVRYAIKKFLSWCSRVYTKLIDYYTY